MAHWTTKERVYFGDRLGDPVEAWAGIVTVGKRTTIGIQFHANREDMPDLTLDGAGMRDVRELFQRLEQELPTTGRSS